ncbi:MAG: DUF134 domain-containing protein [Clostridiales bacterium]|jgi:predicted DNA-binding protein (UPF0251 family)|nr:DUF134 domain-containing protein [Clostridiales bacterium]
MARPVKHRRICELPRTLEFGPCSNQNAGVTELAVDEYEAIRLIDYLDFTQEECAVQMRVARTTVQSIYDSARKKIADALINGKRLVIRGGCYDICSHAGKCCGKNCARRKRSAMCCENCELHCQRSRNKVDKA